MKNLNILKNIFYKFPKRYKIDNAEALDDIQNLEITPDMMKTIKEREMILEAQRREQLRKAHEFAKKREQEVKSGNRKMLLDMKIPNITEKPEKSQIVGFKNGFFSVNGLWIPGSVLVFPNRAFMWGVVDAHDIKEHTLDILKVIKPRPSKKINFRLFDYRNREIYG